MKLASSVLGVLSSAIPCRAVVVQREAHLGSLSVRSPFARAAPVSVQALLELEDQLGKMATGTVDPAGDLLGEVGTLIRDTMMPGIVSSHNSTQQQLDGFAAAFDACPDPQVSDDSGAAVSMLIQTGSVSRSSDETDDALSWRRRRRNRRRNRRRATTTTTTTGVIQGKFVALDACRKRQAAAAADNTKCQDDLAPLETAKNASCHALKNLETKPVPEDFCTPTDPYDQWLISTKGRVGEMKQKLTGLKDGCGNATQLADDKKKECAATQGAVDGNKTDCDQQQAEVEAAQCAESGPDRQRCTTYETCYNNAVSAYTSENATIVAMHLNWTVQWRTLKRMECLLDIMAKGGTNDDIDACKAKLWDTTWLDLNYPAIPPQKECSALAKVVQPGDGDFASQHYGSNPEGAPAAPAMACPEPSTPPPSTTSSTYAKESIASVLAGGSGGGDFNDFTQGKMFPKRICLYAGSHVDAIQVDYYQGGNSIRHGGGGGGEKCVELAPDERIIFARGTGGNHDPMLLDGFSITTNHGKKYNWGAVGSVGFDLKPPADGYEVCGFAGKVGGMVDALGVVWCRGY